MEKIVIFTFFLQAQRKQRKDAKPKRRRGEGPQVLRRASSLRHSQRSVGRSGFAFSHQEGYGELITSGRIMSDVVPRSATGSTASRSKSRSRQAAGAATADHVNPVLQPAPPQPSYMANENRAFVSSTENLSMPNPADHSKLVDDAMDSDTDSQHRSPVMV